MVTIWALSDIAAADLPNGLLVYIGSLLTALGAAAAATGMKTLLAVDTPLMRNVRQTRYATTLDSYSTELLWSACAAFASATAWMLFGPHWTLAALWLGALSYCAAYLWRLGTLAWFTSRVVMQERGKEIEDRAKRQSPREQHDAR